MTVWTDRDDPYERGEGARVYLSVDEPSHVAVFRVDTDGRIRVLFPREPWTESYVRDERELEVTGVRGDRSFLVDDDPGVGYVFAIAATEPFDFRFITRGDYWDYRLIDGGGRIQGDPYVTLTDLAARLVPDGDYDYDVTPYYVDHRYDYPRFVCYDCHAYASYDEWNPYRASCTRYRVVIRDDPRFYPYRYGGRNVVAGRPAHPGPRFVFRDADPSRAPVSRGEPERRRGDDDEDVGRTSEDIGGRGAVPAPRMPSLRRRDHEVAPELSPARPLLDERRRAQRGRDGSGRRSPHQPPGRRQRTRGSARTPAVDRRPAEHRRARAETPPAVGRPVPLLSADARRRRSLAQDAFLMRRCLLFGLALAAGPLFAQSRPSGAARAAATITAADVARRVGIIADDSMLGRDTPSRGLELTAKYVADQFRRFGLRPGGDGGGWFQRYTITRRRFDRDALAGAAGGRRGRGRGTVRPVGQAGAGRRSGGAGRGTGGTGRRAARRGQGGPHGACATGSSSTSRTSTRSRPIAPSRWPERSGSARRRRWCWSPTWTRRSSPSGSRGPHWRGRRSTCGW